VITFCVDLRFGLFLIPKTEGSQLQISSTIPVSLVQNDNPPFLSTHFRSNCFSSLVRPSPVFDEDDGSRSSKLSVSNSSKSLSLSRSFRSSGVFCAAMICYSEMVRTNDHASWYSVHLGGFVQRFKFKCHSFGVTDNCGALLAKCVVDWLSSS